MCEHKQQDALREMCVSRWLMVGGEAKLNRHASVLNIFGTLGPRPHVKTWRVTSCV